MIPVFGIVFPGAVSKIHSRSKDAHDIFLKAFLIEDGRTIDAAWMLGRELPDLDAVIATAGRD